MGGGGGGLGYKWDGDAMALEGEAKEAGVEADARGGISQHLCLGGCCSSGDAFHVCEYSW